MLSSPSPLQNFLSSLCISPRGNPLLHEKWCSWFLFRHLRPSPARLFGCLVLCFVCLCVRVTDRQLARVQGLTHDSSLNFPSRKNCKWGANYTVQSLSGHLDLESFGEPADVEFMNFIKDKSAAAATRVSWFRWAKHFIHYFLMAQVWRNKLAACLQAGIYCSVAILMKTHMTTDPWQSIFSYSVNAVHLPGSGPDTNSCWIFMQQGQKT